MITFLWTLLASKWLSWIPALAALIWKGISYFFRGLFSFMQTPHELFAVVCIAVIVCAATFVATWQFAGEKYNQCEADKLALWKDMSNKDRADAQKAAAAVAARKAAEEAERARQANTAKLNPLTPMVSPDRTSAVAIAPAPTGVRKPANKVRRRECESWLFGCL